jgi:hypothetical protein
MSSIRFNASLMKQTTEEILTHQEVTNNSSIQQFNLALCASQVPTLTRSSATPNRRIYDDEYLIADAKWPDKVLTDERSHDVIDEMLNCMPMELEEELPPRPIGLTRQITNNHLRSDYDNGSFEDEDEDEDEFPRMPVLTRQNSCDNELTDVAMESIIT